MVSLWNETLLCYYYIFNLMWMLDCVYCSPQWQKVTACCYFLWYEHSLSSIGCICVPTVSGILKVLVAARRKTLIQFQKEETATWHDHPNVWLKSEHRFIQCHILANWEYILILYRFSRTNKNNVLFKLTDTYQFPVARMPKKSAWLHQNDPDCRNRSWHFIVYRERSVFWINSIVIWSKATCSDLTYLCRKVFIL